MVAVNLVLPAFVVVITAHLSSTVEGPASRLGGGSAHLGRLLSAMVAMDPSATAHVAEPPLGTTTDTRDLKVDPGAKPVKTVSGYSGLSDGVPGPPPESPVPPDALPPPPVVP